MCKKLHKKNTTLFGRVLERVSSLCRLFLLLSALDYPLPDSKEQQHQFSQDFEQASFLFGIHGNLLIMKTESSGDILLGGVSFTIIVFGWLVSISIINSHYSADKG